MGIKNVVFDVGNVLVEWKPHEVISAIFPEYDPEKFYRRMKPVWLALNLGSLTEKEAIFYYQNQFHIPHDQVVHFMDRLKQHQVPIAGSLELLKKLDQAKINLYSITDNVKEIIEYHILHSHFIAYFKDIIVSAEVGFLKPDPKIYECLLNKHNLNPGECVFIDDLKANVEGARSVGMHAIQFIDTESCEARLNKLGIQF